MRVKRWGVVMLGFALTMTAVACGDDGAGETTDGGLGDPGDCIVVDLALSPEKIDLMTALAQSFNGSDDAQLGDRCVFANPRRKSSGAAARLLYTNWDEEVEGPRPVVWSPAASTWGAVVNLRLGERSQDPIVAGGEPFMQTPLVIAMHRPMAEALGWPNEAIGWSDILGLAREQAGWGAFGHPEWGPFRLGKTNPNFSTSGLAALIAQSYAATGKTSGLSAEDLDQPDVISYGTDVESAVVHYGDTTLTFLNNLYKADRRDAGLTYVSAVAVEEKSVIDYNTGNPDGVLDAGEQPRPPQIPLVAIYPEEGTLFSDNPYFILDAPWVSDEEKDAARLFEDFIKRPENQQQVLRYNFRPGNPSVPVDDPISRANGVDPDQPQTLLEVPEPAVLSELLDRWSDQRKKARVTFVLDVSGSMGDPADPDDFDAGSKLDLAKQAAINSLDLFAADDEVSLVVFSTNLGDSQDQDFLELVPAGRVADIAETIRQRIRGLVPTNGTPLYSVTQATYEEALENFDPTRINAVVLLTDGRNDDGDPDDDDRQLDELLASMRSGSEGQDSRPVRVFPVAYGSDADLDILRSIADAASSLAYDAKNPATIDAVLTAVISNF